MFSVTFTEPTCANATDVVAAEVHQHHVLGALLRVGEQFEFEGFVLLAGRTARTCTRDRTHRDGVTFEAHEDLGTRPDDVEAAEVVIEHVGRRIQRPQRAVQRERRCRVRMGQPLRQHDLHDVAVVHVALRALDGLDEGVLAEFGLRRHRLRRHLGRHRDRLAQRLEQHRQLHLRFGVGTFAARIRVDDEVELAREIVDDRKPVGQHQQDVRCTDGIGLVAFGDAFLDIPHRLVAEVADESAGESRQPGDCRRLEPRVRLAHPFERIRLLALRQQRVAAVFAAEMAAHFEAQFGR